jgi:hypothetical protein
MILVMLFKMSVFMSGGFDGGLNAKSPPPTNGNWIDVADTGWYYSNPEGTGFVIKSAEELAGLAKLVNDRKGRFFGKTIRLASSVDLAGRKWTPISGYTGSYHFQGTLDGQGHTIANMTFDVESYYAGFFGHNAGTVKDVNLTGVYVSSFPSLIDDIVRIGGIAGWNDGMIEGCTVSGYVSAYSFGGSSDAGGIAGWNFGKIAGCASSGDISASALGGDAKTGGIAVSNNGTVEGCVFRGNVYSYAFFSRFTSHAGNIAVFNSGTAESCVSSGDVYPFYFFAPLAYRTSGIAGYGYGNLKI